VRQLRRAVAGIPVRTNPLTVNNRRARSQPVADTKVRHAHGPGTQYRRALPESNLASRHDRGATGETLATLELNVGLRAAARLLVLRAREGKAERRVIGRANLLVQDNTTMRDLLQRIQRRRPVFGVSERNGDCSFGSGVEHTCSRMNPAAAAWPPLHRAVLPRMIPTSEHDDGMSESIDGLD
jgi:hypothetical protein